MPAYDQNLSVPLLLRIRRSLTFLGVFFAIAVAAHKTLTGCTWLDAVYFFVITVTTVGYGEVSTISAEQKLLTIAIILIGVFGVGYTVALIVQSMVEGQINQALGARRMEQEIDQMKGHAIICGFGRIGRTIAAELARRKKRYVVIDSNQEVADLARTELGELVVVGDATDEETLLHAGIERATTIVIGLRSDSDNVFLTLTARNLNPTLRIIARGEQAATEKKLRQAGADQVVLPAVIGGRRMAALVTRPNAAEMLENFTNHEKIDVELEELLIPPSSPLVGATVRDTAARQRHNLMIVGIRRAGGSMVFNPDPDDRFEADDTLVVMGRSGDVESFQLAQRLACEGRGQS
ncbi:potassium channel family protein [Botrimarina hoheduenensis]|uniref:Voltage-gated potassium channel Kch n=1 Tax=Botrimarina hoheduenensis TaxID=2528000 RepID=A0A5C5WF36_9BACT|nr:potassium channel protein [Botrimarina hoheduenensis]TWT48673.1 Voltage-gated potassium channel Kch [Botrimarina hoheduenensis]